MEKLVEDLISLGLTWQEARIYIFFARNGSEKKKDVMRQLGIEEQELEESLQQLTKKGFIKNRLRRANNFSVIPIKIVLESLINEKLREVQEIRKELKILLFRKRFPLKGLS